MPAESEILAERLAAQGLSGPPLKSPEEVAERLLAVQGQDPRGARLAVRTRTEGLHASDVDRALSEERSLLITWLNRGTLHLVGAEDYPWLAQLTTPPLLTSSSTRLAALGVSASEAERGVAEIERALADGPATRAELKERLDNAGIRTEGQAMLHLMFRAAIEGVVVRGPMVGKQHAYVLVRDWLGEQRPVDRDRALAELARRFLAGHAPASERDLARWAGLPLRDARAGLEAIAKQIEVDAEGQIRPRKGRVDAPSPARPRLLGAFDPVLLGWMPREPFLGSHEPEVIRGGLFVPFATVAGRAVGTWKLDRGKVAFGPLDRIANRDRAALEADAADVERFLG
jgi:hypothetical protein